MDTKPRPAIQQADLLSWIDTAIALVEKAQTLHHVHALVTIKDITQRALFATINARHVLGGNYGT